MKAHFLEGFVKHAYETPSAIALIVNGEEYTYRQLFSRSCAIIDLLNKEGIKRNCRVGIFIAPGLDMYAAIIGVLISGSAYVPLPCSYPAERLQKIADCADLAAAICGDRIEIKHIRLSDKVKVISTLDISTAKIEDIENYRPILNLDKETAYILFTSGSTGDPKGVVVSHGNVSSFINWANEFVSVTSTDRLSGHSEISFDLSVFDMYVAWSSGACLIPVTESADRSLPSDFISKYNITIWFSVPSVLSGLIMLQQLTRDKFSSLRWMIFCGEPLPCASAGTLMKALPSLKIANLYGPTEATVASSAYVLKDVPGEKELGIPIGWGTKGTGIFVLTEEGRIAEDGDVGEIYIYGDQVAKGYWNNDEETKNRFVSDPRPDSNANVCFKTGDLAIVTSDGPVFKGRADSQIKFRGWRIELGDVENNLNALKEVVECAVVLIKRDEKADALVAFIRGRHNIRSNEILLRLKDRVPSYMIPTHIRFIDDFPRTRTGKIDRKTLIELF